MPYLIALVIIIFSNALPAFGPSTVMVLSFFQIRDDWNLFLAVLLGIVGSTIGRFILAKTFNSVFHHFNVEVAKKNIIFFEKLLHKNSKKLIMFISIYCMFPTPTNWLFIPIGKNNRILAKVLLGHAIGRVVNYSYTLFFIKNSFEYIKGNLLNPFSIENILILLVSIIFIFIDWSSLFSKYIDNTLENSDEE